MPSRNYLVHMETTTTRSRTARRLIQTVLRERLAANAWLSEVQAYYLQGARMHRRKEHFVAFKTEPAKRGALLDRIRSLHDEPDPYVSWLRLHEPERRFARWVDRRTRRSDGGRRRASRRRASTVVR